jgi:hypothetical protein
VQDFGTIGPNMPADGFTSQWQTVGDNKVFVNDDGTAISTNTKTGATSSLSADQVNNMIKDGKLNTYASGYNTATGGNKTAPGGSGIATTPAKAAATTPAKTGTGAPSNQPQGTGLGSLLPLLLMMYAASQNKGSGSGAPAATIPALTATQTQTPYTAQTQSPTYRPGQGGISYFNPVQYTPKMAAGGIAGLGAASGRFLKGAGDGVSDSIPATIGSNQPARLARGEFVVDARTVSELGNGSSEAGADKLLKMMERVHQARKKAGRGKDSHADQHLPA